MLCVWQDAGQAGSDPGASPSQAGHGGLGLKSTIGGPAGAPGPSPGKWFAGGGGGGGDHRYSPGAAGTGGAGPSGGGPYAGGGNGVIEPATSTGNAGTTNTGGGGGGAGISGGNGGAGGSGVIIIRYLS